MNKKNKKFSKGFTLVELIIVVTILAVLATIAFISFNWYTKNTRDSQRLGTLKNIETWLQLYQTKSSKLPLPEDNIIISYSWWTFWYQWYIWEETSRLIWLNETPLDPFDNKKYTYSINYNQNSYQLLTHLEVWENLAFKWINLVNKTYAAWVDYSNRYPKVFWKRLWILLWNSWENKNRPLQELKSVSFTWIDVKTYTWILSDWQNLWNLKVLINNEVVIEDNNIQIIKNNFEWTIWIVMVWPNWWCPKWWIEATNLYNTSRPPAVVSINWHVWKLCEAKDNSKIEVWSIIISLDNCIEGTSLLRNAAWSSQYKECEVTNNNFIIEKDSIVLMRRNCAIWYEYYRVDNYESWVGSFNLDGIRWFHCKKLK